MTNTNVTRYTETDGKVTDDTDSNMVIQIDWRLSNCDTEKKNNKTIERHR